MKKMDIKDDFLIWYNGSFVKRSQIKIDPLTHSLHYSTSVFEGERAYNGSIFKLEEHTERLIYSAETIGMKVPFSKNEIINNTQALLKMQDLKDCYVRPLIWRGHESMKMGSTINSINILVAAWAMNASSFEADHDKALRIIVSKWRKPPAESNPYKAKTAGGYLTLNISKQDALEQGFDDALMLDWRGFVCECTVSNIFFVKDGELYTPIADCFLNGITKQTIEIIAKENGIKVNHVRITMNDLVNFSESFITGTTIEVKNISLITDGSVSKEFREQKITNFLKNKYKALVTQDKL